jgi:hypothetical protein
MKQLACLALLLAPLACGSPVPPKQIPETEPRRPRGGLRGPSAAAADIGASLDPGVPTAPSEPFPGVPGTLDGKPWELKGAATAGPCPEGRQRAPHLRQLPERSRCAAVVVN